MFVQAHSFTNANRGVGDIERIVFHTAQIVLSTTSAEAIARFFASQNADVSAHTTSDVNSLIECVKDEDIAFHARGDNAETLGHEFAAMAEMSAQQWRGEAATKMLQRTARYYAPKCVKYDIPVRWLTPEQERLRVRGFVTHKVVSDVFGEGIRSDPGEHFPYKEFLAMVRAEISKLNPTPAPAHLPEWRVVIDGRIERRETQKPGQRPTAYDRMANWIGSTEGETRIKAAAKNGLRPELVFKP